MAGLVQACPGHPRLWSGSTVRRGCPRQARACPAIPRWKAWYQVVTARAQCGPRADFYLPQSCFDARAAPLLSALSFAHTMLAWISFEPAKVAKPQSEPAMTFSRPTTLA